jgi:integrase
MPTTLQNVTARVVDRCVGGDPNAAPNTFIRDTSQSGFAILIGKTKSSYVVEGRAGRGGRVVRYTLGTVGRLELDEARAQAKERIAELARGSDPVAALRAKRGITITMREALALLSARDIKATTIDCYERDLVSLGWLDRRVTGIKPSDVLAAYDKRKAKPTSTARIFRSFRSCWNAARAQHPSLPECPTSALRNVRRGWATAPRKRRVVDDASLPLWRKQVAALDRVDVRDLLLFLHYTGCRIGETRALTAADVDLNAGRFTLAAPKNGRPVDLPITTQVRSLLERRIKAGDAFLFPQGDVRKSHADVNATPWSYHDLRRGFVTAAHRLGVDNDIARALTNHAQASGDAHSGYVSLTADTLRPAAQRIADHLDKVARSRPRDGAADVIPLRRRA